MRLQLVFLTISLLLSTTASGLRNAIPFNEQMEAKAHSVMQQLPQIVYYCSQNKNPCELGLKELETLQSIKYHVLLRTMILTIPTEKPTSYEFLTHTLFLNADDLTENDRAKSFAEVLNLSLNTLATDAMEKDDVHYDLSFLKEMTKSTVIPLTKLTVQTSQIINTKNTQTVSQGFTLNNDRTQEDLTQDLTDVLQCVNPQWKLSNIEPNKHRTGFVAAIQWFCHTSRYKAELHVSRLPDETMKLRLKRKIRFH